MLEAIGQALLPIRLALCDGYVAIDGQVSKSLDRSARRRPLDIQPIELGAFADSEHNPRIVRRKIASPADLHAAALEISGLIGNQSADSVDVALLASQFQPQPAILAPGIITSRAQVPHRSRRSAHPRRHRY